MAASDPVVLSLLDSDLYKFTMWQPMLHRHPQTQAVYRFVLRNAPAYPLALAEVNAQLDDLCRLCLRRDELEYLAGLRFANLGFGIGTNLTNDVGHTPLNIVMSWWK